MATIIVEDGTIVENANSYVDVSTFTAYAANRGIDIAGDASTLLVSATDYLETLKFVGTKETRDQPLQWPRVNVYIDGFYYAPTDIPSQLKTAQMEVAMSLDSDIDPQAPIERKTTKEKVGPIEVEYSESSASNTINPKISSALKGLTVGLGGFQFAVSRA